MVDKQKDHLGLYSVNCKRCQYLDPDETKKFTQCHYSKGNEFCPAEEIQIVVVGKAQKLAQQVLTARQSRNIEAESKILGQVALKNAAFVERFYYFLEQGQ